MVILAYNLYQRYYIDTFINELKVLALKNKIPYECVSLDKEDDGKLRKLYVETNRVEDDKFGMTYYILECRCIDALSELYIENDDWDDEDEYEE